MLLKEEFTTFIVETNKFDNSFGGLSRSCPLSLTDVVDNTKFNFKIFIDNMEILDIYGLHSLVKNPCPSHKPLLLTHMYEACLS
jgi:hypothetical protein